MKKKVFELVLRLLIASVTDENGHEVARVCANNLTERELRTLAGTFKEAEIRRKEMMA